MANPELEIPHPTGDRLGLIVGSSMTLEVLHDLAADGHATDVSVESDRGAVELLDIGHALVLHRHHATVEGFRPAHRTDHHRSIAGLCAAGCDRILALGSVGSLRGWPVGTLVAPFDFFAPGVNPTYFDDGRGHAVPGFDEPSRDQVLTAWEATTEGELLDGGVYAQTMGPRFETPAEVRWLAQQADIVGMTLASEAILAREAGLAYAPVCMVDNLGNGLDDHRLTPEEFQAGVLRNRARLIRDLAVVLPLLASAGRA